MLNSKVGGTSPRAAALAEEIDTFTKLLRLLSDPAATGALLDRLLKTTTDAREAEQNARKARDEAEAKIEAAHRATDDASQRTVEVEARELAVTQRESDHAAAAAAHANQLNGLRQRFDADMADMDRREQALRAAKVALAGVA